MRSTAFQRRGSVRWPSAHSPPIVLGAIDEISAGNRAIGQHLAQPIETGAVCCYRLETVTSACAG
jgi:hypothetical protein